MVSQTARRFNNSFLHKYIPSPHSIASHLVPTPRWQELGPTCLLQLLVPKPSEPHQNPKSPKPSKPSEPSKTHQTPELQNLRNRSHFLNFGTIETHNLRNLQNRRNFPNLRNAISGTWNLRKTSPRKTLGTKEPVRTHRNLEPVSRTAPARPEHTEIYIVQIPHSILLLGTKYCAW